MATFNGAKYIEEQIDSILPQLIEGDELIILDNESTDGTFAILKDYADRFPLIRLASKKQIQASGVQNAISSFESVLGLASNEVIFLSDQDDIWLPNKVEISLRALKRSDLVVSDASIVDASGSVTIASFMSNTGLKIGPLASWIRNPYLGCAMAFKRSVLMRALPFPSKVPMHDIWIGIVGQVLFKAAMIKTPLIHHRRHGHNSSAVSEQSMFSLFDRFKFRYFTLVGLIRRAIRRN